ncbi:LuxR C-terminal-related transcriptional regulator [Citrobacter rodentium]|jgi:DNA-binding HTH domain-containing proteins|uniref:Regulatory protein n=2 Tax=Citrobacter rodentium TaxID=67825 RepID=D2TJM7_CITRI|nr:LuxR C-terminal-related transcriptional regulator [Citrobacter rodentium]KIQ53238.1 hypothetical protein TA05_00225 [Citrobacter rodentium]QBY29380.1 hypothetical protein E2R62_11260 [Citrobacter rodentium]UHO33218.1 LuxR family transcriptional regulator [Citrobacter rodentium NBRC 105723 = DSM 16636]CBG89665.1 putative regulatory protein [Citrobacter rodentium ICC168]HAT8015145.1 hypothetical protein [Citrobacter rodentium NBRC 105723 = DSM 16636]
MNFTLPMNTLCADCQLRCPHAINTLLKTTSCGTIKVAIWPGDNPLFTDSLFYILSENDKPALHEDLLLIDFCLDNIAFFIDDDWLEGWKKTGARIVLVVDRFMQALAHYWHKKHPALTLLPVTGDGGSQFLRDLENVLNGQSIMPDGVTAITNNEISVLRKRITGLSAQRVAAVLNCSLKTVYSCQYSLCRKLGAPARLEKLIIEHFHSRC